jgi:hypothetical protein
MSDKQKEKYNTQYTHERHAYEKELENFNKKYPNYTKPTEAEVHGER